MKLSEILKEELPFENEPTEAREVTELAPKINSAITSVDDSMSYTHFAQAVAKVVRDEYGSHLYGKFAKELIDNLK
tara:strand:+ start:77 stop:304 length:228 start_codon:yes stop_codon:yes gene_type:complete